MNKIFRIFSYLKGYKKEIALNILFNLLYVFASLFSFTMIIPFITVLFGIITPPEVAPEFTMNKDVIMDYLSWHLNIFKEEYGMFNCLGILSVIYLFFAFLSALFRYLGMYFLAPIRNGVIKDLRNDIYKKITILPLSFFSNRRKGDILSRMSSDLTDIEISVISSLQMLVKDPIMVIVFSIALFFASYKLVIFALIILPLAALLIRRIGQSLKRNSQKGQKEIANLISTTEEAIGGTRVIRAYNAQNIIKEKFSNQNNQYTKLLTKIYRRRELASPLTEVFAILAMVLIVLFGGIMVIDNELHPSILIGFVILFARIISPIQSLTTAYYNLQKGSVAAVRLYEILDASERIEERENPLNISNLERDIVLDKVSFSYEDNGKKELVLDEVSLKIKKGETIAIVGASGAGKSTLLDLIPRFHDSEKGNVLIDGIDIKDLHINQLRAIIGIVSQNSILFNDTIYGNISFGKIYSMDEVVEAAKLANAHDFISKLPKGYYTNIGDRGLNLSGGERQRICIARAIIKNPSILLLDEATSALDTQSEKLVQISLENLMRGRTTLVIAHRLSTIINSDKIIVMDKGRIIEVGNHNELIQKQGVYSNLVKLQTL